MNVSSISNFSKFFQKFLWFFYNLIISAVVRIEEGPIGGSYLQGQRASLSCHVTGVDELIEQTGKIGPNQATITWYKNGKQVPAKKKYSIHSDQNTSTLTISDLDGDDTGYYQCITQNSVAMDVGTALVTVETQDESGLATEAGFQIDAFSSAFDWLIV